MTSRWKYEDPTSRLTILLTDEPATPDGQPLAVDGPILLLKRKSESEYDARVVAEYSGWNEAADDFNAIIRAVTLGHNFEDAVWAIGEGDDLVERLEQDLVDLKSIPGFGMF